MQSQREARAEASQAFEMFAARRDVTYKAASLLTHGIRFADLRREADDESFAERVCLLAFSVLRIDWAMLDRRIKGRVFDNDDALWTGSIALLFQDPTCSWGDC